MFIFIIASLLYLLLMSLHKCAILLHLECDKYKTRIPIVYRELITYISHLRFNRFCDWANLIHFQQKTVTGFFLNGHFDATKKKENILGYILATGNNSNMAQFIVVNNTKKLASKCINFPCIIIVPYKWIIFHFIVSWLKLTVLGL